MEAAPADVVDAVPDDAVQDAVKMVCNAYSMDFKEAMAMLDEKCHSSRKRKLEEQDQDQDTIREIMEENKNLKAKNKELENKVKQLIEWQEKRDRQHERDLDYASRYDEDSYCRSCGKSSCRFW